MFCQHYYPVNIGLRRSKRALRQCLQWALCNAVRLFLGRQHARGKRQRWGYRLGSERVTALAVTRPSGTDEHVRAGQASGGEEFDKDDPPYLPAKLRMKTHPHAHAHTHAGGASHAHACGAAHAGAPKVVVRLPLPAGAGAHMAPGAAEPGAGAVHMSARAGGVKTEAGLGPGAPSAKGGGHKRGGGARGAGMEAAAAAGGGLQFSKTLDYKSCDHILCLTKDMARYLLPAVPVSAHSGAHARHPRAGLLGMLVCGAASCQAPALGLAAITMRVAWQIKSTTAAGFCCCGHRGAAPDPALYAQAAARRCL